MKKTAMKTIAIILAVFVLLGAFPLCVSAVNGVPYLDKNGNTSYANNAVYLTPSEGSACSLTNSWIVVSGSVKPSWITVNGNVNLLLADGCTLETQFITVSQNITANGGNSAAAIGGCSEGNAASVTINGGYVKAVGGSTGAGIGGGCGILSDEAYNADDDGIVTVTINGGEIDATGGWAAAGIGGGYYNAGRVIINGGKVTAAGGNVDSELGGGAGIGSGAHGLGDVTINGGVVNARGGAGKYSGGAGIGGGYHACGKVLICGGKVEAEGGNKAAGIGAGTSAGGRTQVTLRGGTVKAGFGDSQGCSNADITLDWTSPDDYYVGYAYNGNVIYAEGKSFINLGNEPVTGTPYNGLGILPGVYTVSFDPGEGSGSAFARKVNPTIGFVIPGCGFTAPQNKFFDSWSSGSTTYNPADRIYFDRDTVLTAQWRSAIAINALSLSTNSDLGNLHTGGILYFTPVFTPEDTDEREVEWSSSDTSVASVSDGKVKLNGVGTAVIRVWSKDHPEIFDEAELDVALGEIMYLDENGEEQVCRSPVQLDGTDWSEEWYLATGNLTLSERAVVSGNVHLILADGCKLTLEKGVNVPENASLHIYACSTGDDMGRLSAKVDSVKDNGAAIGGNNTKQTGSIDINGGNISATAYGYYSSGPSELSVIPAAAAIGGGFSGGAGTVVIRGGIVNADAANYSTAAAIGSGTYGESGSVQILGGKVFAYSEKSSGIGSGHRSEKVSVTLSWTDAENDMIRTNGITGNVTLLKEFAYIDTDEKAEFPFHSDYDSPFIRIKPYVGSYKITVDCGEYGESFVVEDIPGGTRFFEAMDEAGAYDTLNDMETGEYIFRDLATKPLSAFEDEDEFGDDTWALVDTKVNSDMTVYACFYQKIKNVFLTLARPEAGTVVTVTDGVQSPAPVVTLADNSHCYLESDPEWYVKDENEWYVLFEGTFEKNTAYYVELLINPDFGYWLDDDTVVTANGAKVEEAYGRMSLSVSLSAQAAASILGDTDGDGEVTILDATWIQRRLANMTVPYSVKTLMNGDVDADGRLTVTDVTFIQRYCARNSTPYPIGKMK